MSEHAIEQAILQYLNLNGVFAFKFKDQSRFDGKQHRKPLPYQINGVADICIIHRGKTYWVEIKTETGEQSEAQRLFESKVVENGGCYFLWRSLVESKAWLKEFA